MQIQVTEIVETSPEIMDAVAMLLPQLTSASPPTCDQLCEIVSCTTSHLLAAKMDDLIVGLLTLILYRTPSGLRAVIEDVVVDEKFRRKGVADNLSSEALSIAMKKGVRTVSLTSRPERIAANKLYKQLGFERRETNVYSFKF